MTGMADSPGMESDVSVVIPAYKAASTIQRALRSIRGNPAVSCLIVVEDGVFDNLQSVLAPYADVRVITNVVNAGAAAARNVGLAACESTYVFFLDSDDYVDQELVNSLRAALDSTGADVAFGPWCFVYDGAPQSEIKYPELRTNEMTVAAWLRNECFPPCCVMWRAKSLQRIGGWDASFRHNDDAELVIRAMLSGLKLAVTRMGCGFYVQHDSPDRVSTAASAVASNAADQIFQKVADWKSGAQPCELTDAMAHFAYEQARRAYRSGESQLGGMWLVRSRSLGLRGHLGTHAHRILAGLLGLEAKERIASMRDSIPILRHRYK